MSDPIVILFAGSGAFGLPTLRRLAGDGRYRVAGVYTQPDRPAGRGKKLTPTPIAAFAVEQGMNLVRTGNINAEPLPAADVLVVIAFGQKISPAVVDHARWGAINLHASRLPKYRGAAPIHRALLAGETITGNSVIRLADRMDAGAVLAMSAVPIGPLETTAELHDRLADDGVGLVVGVLDQLADETVGQTEQDDAAATSAGKLTRADARIDFTRPAGEIANQIRALSPWPGCTVNVLDADNTPGDTLRLIRTRAIDDRANDLSKSTVASDAAANEALAEGAFNLSAAPTASGAADVATDGAKQPAGTVSRRGRVTCGTGVLELIEVQPAGRGVMPIAAYLRGRPWPVGARLESVV